MKKPTYDEVTKALRDSLCLLRETTERLLDFNEHTTTSKDADLLGRCGSEGVRLDTVLGWAEGRIQ